MARGGYRGGFRGRNSNYRGRGGFNKNRDFRDRKDGFSKSRNFDENKQDRPYRHYNRNNRIKQEQLKETDVGITEYINDLQGFSGIIKARYSDFHVSEINLNGEIAKFSNTDIPEAFKTEEVEDFNKIECPIKEMPKDIWNDILKLMETKENKTVMWDITEMSKEVRTEVHTVIKSMFKQKVTANTVTNDDKKFIQFKRYRKGDDQDRRFNWPTDIPEYVYFIVYKEAMDTLEATYKISDALKMKASSLTYAGVKDRRAKTSQWFCIRKVIPDKLINATRNIRNLKVGNLSFHEEPLKLGLLKGNRFQIALRNVTADDELINKAMESLKNNGFINYYGLQRFGNDKEIPTFDIGLQLLLGNWKNAVKLILKPKVSDDPFLDITKAKKTFAETEDPEKALNCLRRSRNKCLESRLLDGLIKSHKNDYFNSLECVPRNMRLLYLHSFQSLVWNKVVSRRIKEFGLKPITGDLVLLKNGSINEDVLIEEILPEDDESKEDKVQASVKPEVKVLTEEDLQEYSICDIVLPLPGFDVTYPDNVVKVWYKEILEEYGLSLEMPKQKSKTYSLSGAYRQIVAKVENISWKTMRYNGPNDPLIISDYEELKGEKQPEDNLEGQYKALIMDFCLSSSCYATMALREILKVDTSSSNHSKLNDYHCPEIPESQKDDKEVPSSNEKQTEAEDSNSLKRKLDEDEEVQENKKSRVDEPNNTK